MQTKTRSRRLLVGRGVRTGEDLAVGLTQEHLELAALDLDVVLGADEDRDRALGAGQELVRGDLRDELLLALGDAAAVATGRQGGGGANRADQHAGRFEKESSVHARKANAASGSRLTPGAGR